MKLLHTTDLHFNQKWFDWILLQQDRFDIFCISGDLLDTSKEMLLQDQINWVKQWILKFEKPLFICSGNHDIDDYDLDNDWLTSIAKEKFYSDGKCVKLNDIKIGCSPFFNMDGFYDFSDCHILLTHVPPKNTKTAKSKNYDLGDEELYRFIKNGLIKPNIVLSGHIHEPRSTVDKINSTIIYNPGVSNDLNIPSHNIIDLNFDDNKIVK